MVNPCSVRVAALAAAVVALSSAAPAWSQQVILGAQRDNTLYENLDVDVSNGAGPVMFSGENANGSRFRGLISFDLSSIPAGATITGVSLRLRMNRTNDGTTSLTTLHRMLASWGEGASVATIGGGGAGAGAMTGDATWRYRFYDAQAPENSIPWTSLGGDFNPTASTSLIIGGIGFYTFTGPGLVSDVQAWLANPSSNFGWMIMGEEDNPRTSRRWETREATTSANRPQLTITYVIPAPSAAIGLLAGTGLATARRRRRD